MPFNTCGSASGKSSAISPGPKVVGAFAVQPHGGAGGLEGRHALRQQAGDEARQHVAGAGGGEPRRGVVVDGGAAVGGGDHGVRPLEDDDGAASSAARRARSSLEPARSPNRRSNSPSCGVSTTGACRALMAREQAVRRRAGLGPAHDEAEARGAHRLVALARREGGQRIGVEHGRRRRGEHGQHGGRGARADAGARADQHGIAAHVAQELRQRRCRSRPPSP